MNKSELGLLWPFYAMKLLYGISAAMLASVMVLYFSQMGLSFAAIGLLLAIQFGASALFEIPTGAIADVFGCKLSVTLSYMLTGIVMLLMALSNDILWLGLLFVAWSAFGTLASGADQAWMVNLLKRNRQERLIHTAYTRLASFVSVGYMIGGIASGLVVLWFGLNSIWLAAGIVNIITALILMLFGHEYFVRSKALFWEKIKNTFTVSKEGASYVRHHPVLFWLVASSFFGAFAGIWQIVWQPYAFQLGLSAAMLGPIISIGAALGIFLPLASMRLLKMLKSEKRVLVLEVSATALFCILMAFADSAWQVAVMLVIILSMGSLIGPIVSQFRQRFIPSESRATITSIDSAVMTGAGFISFLLGGILAETLGFRLVFVISAAIYVLVLACYLKMRT